MKKSGKIHSCGVDDRYGSGACRPCALKKQNIRNREGMLPIHLKDQERHEKNKELRDEASSKGLKHYESLTPCGHCGDYTRYVCNQACIGCN